jgi:hypothetical protein
MVRKKNETKSSTGEKNKILGPSCPHITDEHGEEKTE